MFYNRDKISRAADERMDTEVGRDREITVRVFLGHVAYFWTTCDVSMILCNSVLSTFKSVSWKLAIEKCCSAHWPVTFDHQAKHSHVIVPI